MSRSQGPDGNAGQQYLYPDAYPDAKNEPAAQDGDKTYKRAKKGTDIIIYAAAVCAALTLIAFTVMINLPGRSTGSAAPAIPVSGSEPGEKADTDVSGTAHDVIVIQDDIMGVGVAVRDGAILSAPRADGDTVCLVEPDRTLYIIGIEDGYYHVRLTGEEKQGYILVGDIYAEGIAQAVPDAAEGTETVAVEYGPSDETGTASASSDRDLTTAQTTAASPGKEFTTAPTTAAPTSKEFTTVQKQEETYPSGRSGELRAVWIAFFSETNITPEKIDNMVENCRRAGFNAIMFHVRPFGDAMYPSELFPWSHIACGTQGEAPAGGFDPLAYIVGRAHANGMELHAWINPLRIQREGGVMPSYLSPDNPYIIWRNDGNSVTDGYVVDYNGGKFYNPAEPAVRDLIADGVREIVRNYDVDGIHWDDYFYPAPDESFDDGEYYREYLYGGGGMSLSEWRTDNINRLVRQCYSAVKETDPGCVFGISPAGNIKNCLRAGADVYEWCSHEGYIDYICPQIYWPFDSPAAPFDSLCLQWKDMVTVPGIRFYVGLALYKGGSDTADGGRWKKSSDMIARQIRYCRSEAVRADGYMVFSYDDLFTAAAAKETENMIRENKN